MKTVIVNKDRLLQTLKANRDSHRAKFLKAQDGYRIEVIEQLDAALQKARDGKEICTSFRLMAPQDQTADYDTAIKMLDWTLDDKIELEHQAFCELVLDEWHWKNQWESSNAFYMTKTR